VCGAGSHPSDKNKDVARVGHPDWHPSGENLVDLYVAGAGLDADRGAAAIDLAGDVVLVKGALDRHLVVGEMLPEPVEASSVRPVLPGQSSTLPEPVSSFQSEAGEPATLMSPEPVPARSPP